MMLSSGEAMQRDCQFCPFVCLCQFLEAYNVSDSSGSIIATRVHVGYASWRSITRLTSVTFPFALIGFPQWSVAFSVTFSCSDFVMATSATLKFTRRQ